MVRRSFVVGCPTQIEITTHTNQVHGTVVQHCVSGDIISDVFLSTLRTDYLFIHIYKLTAFGRFVKGAFTGLSGYRSPKPAGQSCVVCGADTNIRPAKGI